MRTISGQDTAGLLLVLAVAGYVGYQVLYASTHTAAPDPDAWLCYYGPPTDHGVPGVPATTEPIIPTVAPTASTAGTSCLGTGVAMKTRCYPSSRDLIGGEC